VPEIAKFLLKSRRKLENIYILFKWHAFCNMSSDTTYTNKPTMDETMEGPIDEAVDNASAKKNKRDFLNHLARASTLALRNMHNGAVEHANATTVVDSFGFVFPSEVMMSVKERLRKNLEAQGIIATIKQASTVPTPVKKIRKKRVTKKQKAVNKQETPIKQKVAIKKKAADVGVSSNKRDKSAPNPHVLSSENQTSLTTQDTAEDTDLETAEDTAIDTDHETIQDETPQKNNFTQSLDDLHADVPKTDSYKCSSPDFCFIRFGPGFRSKRTGVEPHGWLGGLSVAEK